ncbi:MAG: hypothetical protein AMXMBFR13_02910 [Phycisphaerae bacterium]
MNLSNCPSDIPDPVENQLATIPGPHPGTALRVELLNGEEAGVRLEQLAYNPGLGWYVQKSFCVPGSALADLITQLRKADCLNPQSPARKRNGAPQKMDLLPFPGSGRAKSA